MKPCRDCELSDDGGRCKTFHKCSDYIEWRVEVNYVQGADDPQEERGLDYHIDDREV